MIIISGESIIDRLEPSFSVNSPFLPDSPSPYFSYDNNFCIEYIRIITALTKINVFVYIKREKRKTEGGVLMVQEVS